MKQILLFIFSLTITATAYTQQSDYIIIKKRNNRPLKTYYERSFISAVTYSGYKINGYILAIRNDSILIRQEELQLVPTEFGSVIDTIVYRIAVDYRQIEKFNYQSKYTWNRKRGFAQIALPKIMMIGGIGFIALELVNTGYRNDSLTDQKKLLSMGIAATVAISGFMIQELSKKRNKVGGKYKVVYVDVK